MFVLVDGAIVVLLAHQSMGRVAQLVREAAGLALLSTDRTSPTRTRRGSLDDCHIGISVADIRGCSLVLIAIAC